MDEKESDAQDWGSCPSLIAEKFDDEASSFLNFNGEQWLVSIINTVPSILDREPNAEEGSAGRLVGHTAILVEGVLRVPTVQGIRKKLFYGFYHVGSRDVYCPNWLCSWIYNSHGTLVIYKPIEAIGSARTIQNKVKNIKIHNSYPARPEDVLRLILNIKDDHHHYRLAEKGYEKHQKYQLSGSEGKFSHAKGAHNCASWCVKKLEAAFIEVHTGLIAYGKLIPRKISSKSMQDMLGTYDRFVKYLKFLVLRQQVRQERVFPPTTKHKMLGRAALLCGHYEIAIDEFKILLETDRDDLDIVHYLALTYIRFKKYKQGFDCLRRLLTAYDSRGDAWYQRGLIMFIQDPAGMDAPWDAYEECFSQFIDDGNDNYLFAHYGLACVRLWRKKVPDAKQHARAILDSSHNNARIHTLWAWLLIEERKYEEAVKYLKNHCLKGEWSYSYRALAVAYLYLDDLPQAEEALKQSIKLNPDQEVICWKARAKSLLRSDGDHADKLAHLLDRCEQDNDAQNTCKS